MAPRLNPQERERMQDHLKDYIRDKQTLSDVLELTDMIGMIYRKVFLALR